MAFECFDHSTERPVVISGLRNKVCLGAKVLLHLAIQRKRVCDEADEAARSFIPSRYPIMGSKDYEGDSDLELTFRIIERAFSDFELTYWQNFSSTVAHHACVGHVSLYCAWDALRKGEMTSRNSFFAPFANRN